MGKRSLGLLVLCGMLCGCGDDGAAPVLLTDNFDEGELLDWDTTKFVLELRFTDVMRNLDQAVSLKGGCVLGNVSTSRSRSWDLPLEDLEPGSECEVTIAGAKNDDGVPLESPITGTIRVDVEPVEPMSLNAPSGCEGEDIEVSWVSESPGGEYEVEVNLGDGWVTDGVSNVGSESATVNLTTSGTHEWRVTHRTEGGQESATSILTVGVPPVPEPIDWPTSVYDSVTGATFAVEPDPAMPSYEWSLVEGASIVAGEGSESIEVSFEGASSGTMSVQAENDCGASEAVTLSLEVLTDFDVEFPDPALETCVRDIAEIPAPDPMPASVMVTIDQVHCLDLGITDLTGLEHLTGIRVLQLSDNPLTDLSPLASLENLMWVFLERTTITDIEPLTDLTELENVVIHDTEVDDLSPLADSPNLTSLFAFRTKVSDLGPLARLPVLDTLHIDTTPVSDLTPLAGISTLAYLSVRHAEVADLSDFANEFDCSSSTSILLDDNPLDADDCADVEKLRMTGCGVSLDQEVGCSP